LEGNAKKLMNLTAQDLRVGNYVNYECTTHVIDEIHKDRILHHWLNEKNDNPDVYICGYNEILSIPLSKREIEKLGFVLDEEHMGESPMYFDEKGFCIEDDAGDYWLCQHRDEDDFNRIARVDFVHELQNQYFSINKLELTY
jgi:hypothetical protein